MEPVVYTQPRYEGGGVVEPMATANVAFIDAATPSLAKVAIDVPPGLEYLTQLDQLLVKQQVEMMEALTGFETSNKYQVLNSLGQRVYYAVETTGCCTRMCCGPLRPFDIKIVDNAGSELIHLDRRWRPCSACCCCNCCLQRVEVHAPPGKVIGYVQQTCNCVRPAYEIQDADEQTVLRIEGPCCCRCKCCFADTKFNVLAKDGSKVGRITKQWTGLSKELFTDADNYGISFPLDLDVKCKATLLGACFLIDFMFFEQNTKQGKVKI